MIKPPGKRPIYFRRRPITVMQRGNKYKNRFAIRRPRSKPKAKPKPKNNPKDEKFLDKEPEEDGKSKEKEKKGKNNKNNKKKKNKGKPKKGGKGGKGKNGKKNKGQVSSSQKEIVTKDPGPSRKRGNPSKKKPAPTVAPPKLDLNSAAGL